jgi:hypothetical protein
MAFAAEPAPLRASQERSEFERLSEPPIRVFRMGRRGVPVTL